eukprot:Sspe_Gene.83058::Locus_54485_Transcript_2_2_Confidence_0.667_Length_737::g.83058::m.83058/K09705/K09705; uncharacterized protein
MAVVGQLTRRALRLCSTAGIATRWFHSTAPPLPEEGAMAHTAVNDIIHHLNLLPHPEGGFFRETFRSKISAGFPQGTRDASTCIYFLLQQGDFSAFHRIKGDEVWHYYSGDPLEVVELHHEGLTVHTLGLDLSAGQRPQAVIPAGSWFASRSLGKYSLVGCTVSPGFAVEDFELATRAQLTEEYPEHAEIIAALTRQ